MAFDPTGHFHTNFALSAEGEYLALSDPQGIVRSQFGPGGQYPAQTKNTSHGVAFDSTFTQVVSNLSDASYLIPTDGSLGTDWTTTAFDDSLWQSGTASLGYEATVGSYDPLIETTLPVGANSVYVRIPFMVNDAEAVLGTLRMKYDDGFVAYLNGTPIAWSNAPANPAYDSEATEFRPKEAAIEDALFDVSAYSDLLQVGENVLSIHLLDAVTSPSQDLLLVPELTIASGEIAVGAPSGGLIAPTPGLPNTQRVASPVAFSRVGGAFASAFQLTLSVLAGETIRYTTDGSGPQKARPSTPARATLPQRPKSALARSAAVAKSGGFTPRHTRFLSLGCLASRPICRSSCSRISAPASRTASTGTRLSRFTKRTRSPVAARWPTIRP